MRRRNSQMDNFNPAARSFPALQQSNMRKPTQRAFESEVGVGFGEPFEFFEEDTARCQRRQFRPQRRQPAGDQIGINEMDNAGLSGQKLAGKSGFSRAIRSGDDDAARR